MDVSPFIYPVCGGNLGAFTLKSALNPQISCYCFQAFEHLCALELVRPADGGLTRTQKEYKLMTLLLDDDQLKQGLTKIPQLPNGSAPVGQHSDLDLDMREKGHPLGKYVLSGSKLTVGSRGQKND